jgi:hypothetical protein
MDKKRIYLLVFNQIKTEYSIFMFNMQLDLLNSISLNKLSLNNNINSKNYFKLHVYNNKIYMKSKTLFGTRLDIMDTIYGTHIDRYDIPFLFNSFYVDKQDENKMVFLSVFDSKFYTFDLIQKCIINSNYYIQMNKNDRLYNIFCLNKQGKIITFNL